MGRRSKRNQSIYETYLWRLLAGDVTPSAVGKRYNLGRSTVGMWVTGARKKLGGKILAAQIARKILNGDLVPVAPIEQDTKNELLKDHLESISNCLPEFVSNDLPVEAELKRIIKNLILNVRGQAERGTFRYAGQDCAGRLLQLERDLTPKEQLTLVNVIERCADVDYVLRTRRSKTAADLTRREREVSKKEKEIESKQFALAALFSNYESRLAQLKQLENSKEDK